MLIRPSVERQINVSSRISNDPIIQIPANDVVQSFWIPTGTDNPLSSVELNLLTSLPFQSVDLLRQVYIQALTTDRDPSKGARRTLQIVAEDAISCVVRELIPSNSDTYKTPIDTKRKLTDVEEDINSISFALIEAINEATTSKTITPYYGVLLTKRVTGKYTKERIAAIAALLLMVCNRNQNV